MLVLKSLLPPKVFTSVAKVADEPDWSELPSGPEFKRLRQHANVRRDLVAVVCGVTTETVRLYETERVTKCPSLARSETFRLLVTAFRHLAAGDSELNEAEGNR
jgi:hypothetical protein